MQEKQTLNSPATYATVVLMVNEERLSETIPAFRVTRTVYELLNSLKAKERRNVTDIARALLERGLAAQQRDGLLFEPEQPGVGPTKITVPVEVSDLDPSLTEKKKSNKR